MEVIDDGDGDCFIGLIDIKFCGFWGNKGVVLYILLVSRVGCCVILYFFFIGDNLNGFIDKYILCRIFFYD